MTSAPQNEAALERIRKRLARNRAQWITQMRENALGTGNGAASSSDGGVGDMLRLWWHRHPLKLGLDVIAPLLKQQARRHPVGLLTLAAAVGAALVLLRPWRAMPLAAWVALRSLPLDAWLAALHKILDPNSSSRSDRRRPSRRS
jgi:hypothetical protein